jgi:hypothetical protein
MIDQKRSPEPRPLHKGVGDLIRSKDLSPFLDWLTRCAEERLRAGMDQGVSACYDFCSRTPWQSALRLRWTGFPGNPGDVLRRGEKAATGVALTPGPFAVPMSATAIFRQQSPQLGSCACVFARTRTATPEQGFAAWGRVAALTITVCRQASHV